MAESVYLTALLKSGTESALSLAFLFIVAYRILSSGSVTLSLSIRLITSTVTNNKAESVSFRAPGLLMSAVASSFSKIGLLSLEIESNTA